jgi:hypothetical protein
MPVPIYTTNIWNSAGDAFVRELDFSKITLRLREKIDGKGDDKDNTYAKLVGNTLDTLKTSFVRSKYPSLSKSLPADDSVRVAE